MKDENFGDLVSAEIEKKIKPGKKPEEKKMYTEEEVNERVEKAKKLEEERRGRVDNIPGASTYSNKSLMNNEPKSKRLINLEAEYVKVGLDPALAKTRLIARSKIPGIRNYDPEKEED